MDQGRYRRRATVLGVMAIVLLIAACGRATQEEIDQALGITPTPTEDPAELALATEEAAAAGSNASDDPNVGVAALGRTKFQFNCQTCHSPTGTAPNLLETGGPYAGIDYATLYPILREGEGHSPSPGPYAEFTLTDADIANIAAYIREQASP
ncbi:MAG TPA: cytochrome c [Thermomicrobiales bacterium]|nr:cytochrome c [Thermomicrobiales bacterium]